MDRIVECVPNFSEGRDPAVLQALRAAIEAVTGVRVLDVDPGADTHRTVFTFVGDPDGVAEAAFQAVRTAADLIDMRLHQGEHPRLGATDVVPFVPVSGVTMEECVALADRVGRRIGEELGIPVYLYERAATRPERRSLAAIRAGQYEGLPAKLADPAWAPDHGPAVFHPRAGATVVGAREFLIAYNVNLNTPDRQMANEIVYELRERGRWKREGDTRPLYQRGRVVEFPGDGRHPCGLCEAISPGFEEAARHAWEAHQLDLEPYYRSLGIDPELPSGPVYKPGLFREVKGIGWVIEAYRRAQLSMNLTHFRVSPPHLVLEAARELARERGLVVTGSELVGLIPYEAIAEAGRFYLRRMGRPTGLPAADLVETAAQSMGLREVSRFEAAEKVLGMPGPAGPLVERAVWDFVDEVSRDTPAPGGGSVAALAGALGGALGAMVANLAAGKASIGERYEELCRLAERAQGLKESLLRGVDEDSRAFDSVLAALRLPKDTPARQAQRRQALQAGYLAATRIPMDTMARCLEALELCAAVAPLSPASMITDVGTGALMAHAGLQAAAYNARVNLPQLGDPELQAELEARLAAALGEGARRAAEVAQVVARHLQPPASPAPS